MKNLFDLSIKMLSLIEYDDKYLKKEIFNIASTISSESDLGNAYIINNGKVEYIDSIGFNLKKLKKRNTNIDFYKIKKYSDYKKILHNDIVQSFITALEFHDEYTKGHSELVAMFAMRIGETLGLDKTQLEDLYWAALMHDIGKIIIPISILNKTEKLTDSEFEIIKKHPQIGYEILSKNETLQDISKYVLSHHERWDGRGYPNKLIGEEIPLLSQIISVADCWHAMTSERPYQNKLSEEEAIKDLIKNKGTQFSPKIVDIFIENKLYLIDDFFKYNKIEYRYA